MVLNPEVLFLYLPLIAGIAAGITALSTAGGVAANTVISAKNLSATERHNKELENIAKGNRLNNTNDLMLLLQSINNNIIDLTNEQKETLQNSMSPMFDDELTLRLVAYLTGKEFQIQYL